MCERHKLIKRRAAVSGSVNLKTLCLQYNRDEGFDVWIHLPIVQQYHLHEKLSRREILVCELQFSLIRKEYHYYTEMSNLYHFIRQTVFWNTVDPPNYVRRQAVTLLFRMRRVCETILKDLERDQDKQADSIVVNLHRVFDILYRSTSQQYVSTLIAYCDILSELRTMINRCNDKRTSKQARDHVMEMKVDRILLPFQRLAEQRSTLLKICDDLRDQDQLAKAHRALDNVAAVLDSCYECLSSLHGSGYVADIDNILDLSWKPSSLKYRRHREHYLVLPRPQMTLTETAPTLPDIPQSIKSLSCSEDESDRRERVSMEQLYDLVEVPLDYTNCISANSNILDTSFQNSPLYQTISCTPLQDPLEKETQDPDTTDYIKPRNHQRTLWCQIEPVISTGLPGRLTADERSLMEAKFEIISSEVSYFKSLCVLITIFYESADLRSFITEQDMHSLFTNITQVKEVSEKFLDEAAYSLSRDVLMSDMCSLVRVHAATKFRIYVTYCSNQSLIHSTFQQLMSRSDGVVELLKQLETSSSCQGYSLISFLTLPLQRVTRLPLLMLAIIKRLPDQTSLEYHEATDAFRVLQQLVKECNEVVFKPEEASSSDGTNKACSTSKVNKKIKLLTKRSKNVSEE